MQISNYPYLLLIIGLLVGCTKENTIKTTCTEEKLIAYDFEEYTGQDLNCDFFLILYHFRNKEYYLLGNHCVDMINKPVDCEGNVLCDSKIRTKCNNFYNNAVEVGIGTL